MPPGPGMVRRLDRECLKNVIDSLSLEQKKFAETIKQQAIDYLEAKNQTIPGGISILFMLGFLFGQAYHSLLIFFLVTVIGSITLFPIRKHLMKSLKNEMLSKCNNDPKKINTVEKLCDAF